MASRILIAGCGYVGCELGVRLVKKNHEVWGLKRNPENLPKAIHPLKADITNPGSLKNLPGKLDFVFYMITPDQLDEPSYKKAYVDGLRDLLAAMKNQNQNPKRIFLISSTGVYHQTSGEWVDENSQVLPSHFSGKLLLAGEELLKQSPFQATVVRFAGIYGPGRIGLLDRIREGKVSCPKQKKYTNRIHRDDCAEVLVHLMALKNLADIYIGVDNEPADLTEVLWWLASYMKVPLPPDREASETNRYGRKSNKRCQNDRLVDSGYLFLYPTFREGYAAILKEKNVKG